MISKIVIVAMDEDGDISDGVISSLGKVAQEVVSVKAADFKKVLVEPSSTLVVFVVQTVTNDDVPEKAGTAYRFFKRKTHGE